MDRDVPISHPQAVDYDGTPTHPGEHATSRDLPRSHPKSAENTRDNPDRGQGWAWTAAYNAPGMQDKKNPPPLPPGHAKPGIVAEEPAKAE